MSLNLVGWEDGLRNLCRATRVENEAGLWFKEKVALPATEQDARQWLSIDPCYARVHFLSHGTSAPLALSIGLEEGFLLPRSRGQLINVSLDELQVERGVQLFEDCHRQRIAEWH